MTNLATSHEHCTKSHVCGGSYENQVVLESLKQEQRHIQSIYYIYRVTNYKLQDISQRRV